MKLFLVSLVVLLLCVARPVHCENSDILAVAEDLTRRLYLSPLNIDRAALKIDVDRFELGAAPHAVVIHVFESTELESEELLTVNVVRVRGHLQYLSAEGSALKCSSTSQEGRAQRLRIAVDVLRDVGGYATDRKERRSVRRGFLEMRFVDPNSTLSFRISDGGL
ncbi:MAG: hypothetical protein M3P06_19080 [Acidobacteriota bacterium]|nr:hypothetical protein [Acidobacteriota bacterium]